MAILAIPTLNTVVENVPFWKFLILLARNTTKFILWAALLVLSSNLYACKTTLKDVSNEIVVGAERTNIYFPKLQGRRVGLVVNHTSVVKGVHLLDTLLASGINVQKIFAPEHGFRGTASAGTTIKDGKDAKTGLPVVSLYGKNKKPSVEHLRDLDIVIFDIQDVGSRFYTYISTMHYVLEACAENNRSVIILDRPNPNGHFVAGPVLESKFKSFVGMNPIPVVHGMTVAELASMSLGEGWVPDTLDLEVIPVANYTHDYRYSIPIKPSPNLPNDQSIALYPSLCLFEPTVISVGRGTDKQFQIIGGPSSILGNYIFTPVDKPGALNPVNEGIKCYGEDLSNIDTENMGFTLNYLIKYYNLFPEKETFFTNERFFNLLLGNDWVLAEIKKGTSAQQIQRMWQEDLLEFKKTRKKYLIYPDFE